MTKTIHIHSINSTNTYAIDLGRKDNAEPLWVIADQQTQGRGRRGRTWQGGIGNCLATRLLTPQECPDRKNAAQLCFIAGLAVIDALNLSKITLKWPNDILLEGMKLGGILIERETSSNSDVTVIGFGINLVSHPDDTPYPATNLARHGLSLTAQVLLEKLDKTLNLLLQQWHTHGFEPIRKDWISHATGLGERVRANLQDKTYEGIFESLDPDGALILRLPDNTIQKITAGEIFPLKQTP